jgi:hypothetical protein
MHSHFDAGRAGKSTWKGSKGKGERNRVRDLRPNGFMQKAMLALGMPAWQVTALIALQDYYVNGTSGGRRWRRRESAGKAGEDDRCILDGVRKRVSRASGKSLREMVERWARPEAPHPA